MLYNKRFAIHTLGCKLNFSESSTIARNLLDAGYARVDYAAIADIYVINTCSVTENADKKCKHHVSQALKKNPEAKVIVVGCYAQLKPKEIMEIPGVSMVLGANDKFDVVGKLEQHQNIEEPLLFNTEIKKVDFFTPAYSFGDRTRTFLKVQDGCDYYCSFCTIPLARGRSRSASIQSIIDQAKEIALTNVKEVVLTGVNIGDYGRTEDGRSRTSEDFLQLIIALDEIEGIDRFRISSIEPNLLSENIIQFVAKSKRFMPHFHIPLQSGSDDLLRLMKRKYNTDLYKSRIELIKKIIPDCCIGVDVIVGFPAETEERFKQTFDFLHELDVSYLHVFTYSERANTRALDLSPVVPLSKRKERSKMLRSLSAKKKIAFYEQFAGQKKAVLFESENSDGTIAGFTDNYLKVELPYDPSLENTIRKVKLDKLGLSCFITPRPKPSAQFQNINTNTQNS